MHNLHESIMAVVMIMKYHLALVIWVNMFIWTSIKQRWQLV
jgi:hypothetical protein